MWRFGILAAGVAGSACGRIGFDVVGDGVTGGELPSRASCVDLAPTCGPSHTSDCCASGVVPGGMFLRGYDVATDAMFPDMSHPATVSTFRLDTYEVTVARFRQFVAAGMGTQQSAPTLAAGARALNGLAAQGGWDPAWNTNLAADTSSLLAALACDPTYASWTDAPGPNESRPIVCITWYEAMAFCIWDGGFLPTETESMYAASGGNEQRAYPWSVPARQTTIDCTLANWGGVSWPGTACVASGVNVVGSESPAGDGAWGHADVAGNAWEWVLDWLAPLSSECTDCANLEPATDHVLRGGSFFNDPVPVRAAFHGAVTPRTYAFGVRCAR